MSEYVSIEDALEVVRANGYVAIKEKSYRQAQERQRVADALRCAAEENAKSTQAWVERDLGPEARRLADRLTYVYGVAMAHGATRDELAGSSTGGEAAEHIRKHLLGAGRSDADAKHRDLTSRLGFGDNIAEPMADNDTIVGPTMAASDGHSDIRGQAIEAAAEAHYNYEAASLRPWEEQSNEARELWRTDVRVIVDAVLAVAEPAYRAEALEDSADRLMLYVGGPHLPVAPKRSEIAAYLQELATRERDRADAESPTDG